MKTTRAYLQGCTWCNATGFTNNPNMGYVTNITITCPVCNGDKTIVVTEVTESDTSQISEMTDEEIEKESEIEIPQSSTSTLNVQRMRWIQGAQWARDRQKGGKP